MLNRSLQISPDALFQEIGGEAVILDLASSTYFGLDAIGVRIWQLLQDHPEQATICELLLSEYEVDKALLEQDMEKFIGGLLQAGLVREVGA